MSESSEELGRISDAERWLCVEASPALDAIVRSVEARAGIRIAEFRVTFDRTDTHNGFPVANCTIVRASLVSASERDNSSAANVSNLHDATEATHSPSPRVKGTGD